LLEDAGLDVSFEDTLRVEASLLCGTDSDVEDDDSDIDDDVVFPLAER
jgi:hypothetical protein